MKKILCPTDFSDAANNGIAFAAKLAHKLGAEVILFNVQSSFEITSEEVIHGKSLTLAAVSDSLEAQSREVSKAFKVSCYSEVKSSVRSFVEEVRSKSEGFDLIIMGTSGTDSLYEYFFGSRSYQVAHTTLVPILLVPVECIYADIQRLVYAFDYLSERKLPLKQVIPWVQTLRCKLSVLQVMEEAHSEDAERELKELQEIFRLEADGSGVLEFETIYSEDIASSIHSHVLRVNADAVAFCTHRRNFIENIFHKSVMKVVTGIATYPVFVFHE